MLDGHISLYKIEVFRRVAELGSVSGAAEALHVSQPVVSAHIRSLERRLGVRLFERDGRGIRLTKAGEAAHAWASDLQTRTRDFARYVEGISDGERGSVVFGASMSTGSYLMPSLLAHYRKEHPLVRVSLHIAESEYLIEATAAGQYDFSLAILQEPLRTPNLSAELLRDEELILVAAPGLVEDAPIGIERIPQLPFLDSPEGTTRRWAVNRRLREAGIAELNVALELGHPEAMKRIAKRRVGVALLLRSSVAEEIAAGELEEVEVADTRFTVPLYLLHRSGMRYTSCQEQLIDAIRAQLCGGVAAGRPAV